LKDQLSVVELEELLKTHEFSQNEIHIVPVCRYAPLNRQQYEAWKHVWPLSYREDTRLDPKFTREDIDIIHSHMRDLLSNEKSTVVCRIVDPTANQIMAEASDSRQEHPLHHAVMKTIDAVARKEDKASGRMKRTASQMMDGDEPKKTAYLCTGYDIYITHEPCAM
jgi:tRNA-specific adenosine deaminase 3